MPPVSPLPPFLLMRLADGREIRCRLRLSARARRLRLRVAACGEVVLVIPRQFAGDFQEIQLFAESCSGWLERILRRIPVADPHKAVLPEYVRLPLLGLERRLVLQEGATTSGVRIQDDGSCLYVKGAATHTLSACLALQGWVKAQATAPLIRMVEQAARVMGEALAGVQVRGQRSRWGSCSSRRVISINYRLALVTEELARFVILHELCHLRHMDHSPAYRRYLASFEPHWKGFENALRQAWRELPVWILANRT